LRRAVPVHELDANINDEAFAKATTNALLEMLQKIVPRCRYAAGASLHTPPCP
jgi:hypothetical protein